MRLCMLKMKVLHIKLHNKLFMQITKKKKRRRKLHCMKNHKQTIRASSILSFMNRGMITVYIKKKTKRINSR